MDINARVFDKLKEIIDLPDNVVSLTLRLRAGIVPTLFIKSEFWPKTGKPSIQHIEKRYKLTE